MTAPNPSKPWPNELILAAQALSEQTLQSDGWVLDIEAAFAAQGGREINSGTSRRTDLPGVLSLQSHGGQALACVFRAQAQGAQGPWRVLERHQLGSQTFIPMSSPVGAPIDRFKPIGVLLVASGDDAPDPSTLRALWFHAQQAFTLKPGTWHHPLIALQDFDFLVLERVAGEVDCELCHLPGPVRVTGLN
jgi:ureidoglycolate lyase